MLDPYRIPNSLREGCYQITFRPYNSSNTYLGTLRVDLTDFAISGDLYSFQGSEVFQMSPNIPVYPRDFYNSYLKVIDIAYRPFLPNRPELIKLQIGRYKYNQPTDNSYNGSFPDRPSQRVIMYLSPNIPPLGYIGPSFSGKLVEGDIVLGKINIDWVSPYFRNATLLISTVPDAIAPKPVPTQNGLGIEDFSTIFAKAGWNLNVIYNPKTIPVPEGTTTLTKGVCPSEADLHSLLSSIEMPRDYLDKEWLLHLLIVPGKLGCSRGIMFDTSRKGAAIFSDDGYPSSESDNYGWATNKLAWEVPRAFLRSAVHEVGHGFNQIHQDITNLGEPGADNSIMTPTPLVADVLGNPNTGQTGFPDQINLRFNNHVRHHLVHFPDPIVRPGAMNFETGHNTFAPQAVDVKTPIDLQLNLIPEREQIKMGQPLNVRWQLVNNSELPIPFLNDIQLKTGHVHLIITNPMGFSKKMSPYVVQTDNIQINYLQPRAKLEGDTHAFWSHNGFAFEMPGRHIIEVEILWNDMGQPFTINAITEVWVDNPKSEIDKEIASLLLDNEVGTFVALGGGASHLKNAIMRIEEAISKDSSHSACQCFKNFKGHKYSICE